MIDIIIIGIILLCLVEIFLYFRKQKKAGRSGCCGGCSHCSAEGCKRLK